MEEEKACQAVATDLLLSMLGLRPSDDRHLGKCNNERPGPNGAKLRGWIVSETESKSLALNQGVSLNLAPFRPGPVGLPSPPNLHRVVPRPTVETWVTLASHERSRSCWFRCRRLPAVLRSRLCPSPDQPSRVDTPRGRHREHVEAAAAGAGRGVGPRRLGGRRGRGLGLLLLLLRLLRLPQLPVLGLELVDTEALSPTRYRPRPPDGTRGGPRPWGRERVWFLPGTGTLPPRGRRPPLPGSGRPGIPKSLCATHEAHLGREWDLLRVPTGAARHPRLYRHVAATWTSGVYTRPVRAGARRHARMGRAASAPPCAPPPSPHILPLARGMTSPHIVRLPRLVPPLIVPAVPRRLTGLRARGSRPALTCPPAIARSSITLSAIAHAWHSRGAQLQSSRSLPWRAMAVISASLSTARSARQLLTSPRNPWASPMATTVSPSPSHTSRLLSSSRYAAQAACRTLGESRRWTTYGLPRAVARSTRTALTSPPRGIGSWSLPTVTHASGEGAPRGGRS